MNDEDRKRLKEISERRKGDKDVDFLNSRLIQTLIKLEEADVLAMTVDVFIHRGFLDARSLVDDARLIYGDPWKYEYASKEVLLKYKRGIKEITEIFSEEES